MKFTKVKNSGGDETIVSDTVEDSDENSFIVDEDVENADPDEFLIFTDTVSGVVPRITFLASSDRVFVA